MKAKACTRCRQWKIGCDTNDSDPNGCTRCQSHGVPCVFDRAFRRTPKRRKMVEMQAELDELRRVARVAPEGNTNNPPANLTSASPTQHSLPNPAVWPVTIGPELATLATASDAESFCIADKYIGDVHLAASYVNELFRIYFLRCHPYLPFSMCRSIELIYERCPILFWVICAAASADTTYSQFEEPVRNLISDVLNPLKVGTVEIVQAVLILCMWPFPFINQKTDSSFIYSGLATHIGLSIGLHRPAIDAGLGQETSDRDGDEEIRRTTWAACFVVAQIQANRRGVPAMVLADYSLLASFDSPTTAQELSHLCYISRLTVEATHTLGARGSNTAGLVEPSARMSMIAVFGKQFDDLRRQWFPKPSEVVELFFLSSRLQLWSFVLHNDIPESTYTVQIFYQAKRDAIRLIQVACEKNLSLVPFYTRRSVCFAALLLYRIKLSHSEWQDSLMDHHIERAQQALSACEGPKVGLFLATVTSPDHRDTIIRASREKHSPHRSRMGAFLIFDFQQIYQDLRQANTLFLSDFSDFENLLWTEFQ